MLQCGITIAILSIDGSVAQVDAILDAVHITIHARKMKQGSAFTILNADALQMTTAACPFDQERESIQVSPERRCQRSRRPQDT